MFKTAVGYFFLQLSIIGLVINLGVLIPLSRIKKKGDKNYVYLISIVTILNDTINLFVNCCYFAPTIIASNYILADTPDAFGPMLMASLTHFCWYNDLFIMIVMISNRLILLIIKEVEIITKKRIIISFVFFIILSSSRVLVDLFVIPCCVMVMDFEKFGFALANPKNETNISAMIDFPIEISIFSITILCYTTIFIKTRESAIKVEESLNSKHQKKIRARERSTATQFFTISIFTMLTYASFKLTPLIFGENCVECNIIFPIVYSVNCCATGCVFMFMNEEVNEDIMKRIFKNNSVHSTDEGGNPNNVPFENPELMI